MKVLRENKKNIYGQGLNCKILSPCVTPTTSLAFLRTKSDLAELNNINKCSFYLSFKRLAVSSSGFNVYMHRGASSTTWIQVLTNNNNLIVDVLGITNGRYIFNNLVTNNYIYEVLIIFDGTKISDKLIVNINNVEYVADSKPATEPTTTGSFTSTTEIGGYTSANTQSNSELYCFKAWNKIVTLDEAKDSLQNPLVDFDFNTIGNSYQFDLSGNNNHALWSGTPNYVYSEYASTRMQTLGYSLYTKSGSPDLYVPNRLDGSSNVVVVGTDVPTGYVKSKDGPASTTYHNLYDSCFNFNYWGGNNPEIAIFDRHNETIHNATSRASGYYDATNIRTWSIFHVSEIKDRTIFNGLLNSDYQNRVFCKVKDNLLKEVLNYKTKKTEEQITKIETYLNS